MALRAAEEKGMMSTASIVSCIWGYGIMGRWDDGIMSTASMATMTYLV